MSIQIKDVKISDNSGKVEYMPMIALRGLTVFPKMTVNFEVERTISINAVNKANDGSRLIFLVTQKDIFKESPTLDDIYSVGTACTLKQFVRSPQGIMRVIVEGICRAKLISAVDKNGFFQAEILRLAEMPASKHSIRTDGYLRQAVTSFGTYLESSGVAGSSIQLFDLAATNDPGYASDYIVQNMAIKPSEKQRVLETLPPLKRLRLVLDILARELAVLEVEHEISSRVQDQFSRMHKESILREQLNIIKSELGVDDEESELDIYREKIKALGLNDEIEQKLLKEVDRLSRQPFGSAEASVIRSYLDICLDLPWNTKTQEHLDISSVRKVLDDDHYGLQKVKERIIEYLAVKQLAPDMKSSILCFVGPPGVGKTSIAISIAKAMNRKLARMSLGGVHDEAEIRGHRKTYVGAMPGRIITAISQAKTMNPLLLLDEIDKLGMDHRGDPASALLEALDPEQNSTFRDNFLEIPFDLSDVFFITTANTTDTIPRPLLDRMEVIELTSYTDEEKLQIARKHLLPNQRKKHGLTGRQLRLSDDVIRDIITGYTRESGVRQLEREIAAVCRKTAALIAEGKLKSAAPRTSTLEDFLGVRKYKPDSRSGKNEIGIVNGLAWTSVGGEILEVEVNVVDGSGKLELTGNLGNVMKESAQAAVSYIRSRADKLGIDHDFYKNKDIHIHFPEGAIPKDGPSAGITIATAVISALTEKPVRNDIAMTGEITLRGRILPIGGLKEKTMAALRYGIKTVVIPKDNEPDLEEIDQTVRRSLNFVLASHIDDIIDLVMELPSTAADPVSSTVETGVLPYTGEHKNKNTARSIMQ